MPALHLLYANEYKVADGVRVRIPTVGEVLDDEDEYYDMVSMLTATPIDMIAQLDDLKIDFTTVSEYDLFLMIFHLIREQDTSLIFGDLDLREFSLAKQEGNSSSKIAPVLINTRTGTTIDWRAQSQIAAVLRKIHHIEKNTKRPANKEAKDYLIQRAREKAARRRHRSTESQLEQLIVSLVCTEQFPYRYADVRDLTIYQFNESLAQVVKKIDYDNRMRGVYAGTVDAKKLSQDDLNWLKHN